MPIDVSTLLINPICRTLLITLWAKAQESKNPDGLFKDKDAERIINQLPTELLDFPKVPQVNIGTAIRVHFLDMVVFDFIANNPNPIIVSIGCGLDNRFQRTDNTKGIHINVDVPEVMQLRQQLMPSNNQRNIDMVGSISDLHWLIKINEEFQGQFCFIAEGVLMYFSEEIVKTFVCTLAREFSGAHLWFDSCGDISVKVMNGSALIKFMNATFKWALNDSHELEKWDTKIKLKEVHYIMQEQPEKWKLLIKLQPIKGILMKILFFIFPSITKSSRINGYQIQEK